MRQALEIALEALNEWRVEWSPDFYEEKYDSDEPEENIKRTLVKNAITAIKEALAQPEQEPVAWESILGAVARGWCYEENANKTMDSELAVAIAKEVQCLYTTPPQRKPLTDEEIILIVAECAASHQHTDIHFAKAIERAHGIKELV